MLDLSLPPAFFALSLMVDVDVVVVSCKPGLKSESLFVGILYTGMQKRNIVEDVRVGWRML